MIEPRDTERCPPPEAIDSQPNLGLDDANLPTTAELRETIAKLSESLRTKPLARLGLPPQVELLVRLVHEAGVDTGVGQCFDQIDDIVAIYTKECAPKVEVPGKWTAHFFAREFVKLCAAAGGLNFVEVSWKEPIPFTVTIQRTEGKTPATMREEAAAERDAARAELEGLKGLLREYLSWAPEEADLGPWNVRRGEVDKALRARVGVR